MHRCQYNKTWSNQDMFPAGNFNWHNMKTMLPSHNNTKYDYMCMVYTKNKLLLQQQQQLA